MIGAGTKAIVLLGDPVEHSLSPKMQNAALAAAGVDAVYLACRVPPDLLPQAVQGVRGLNLLGANVTVPHKMAVMSYLDEVAEEARLLGAVNTIVNREGKLVGYNTDAPGFLQGLSEVGFAPRGRRAVVLGAGGAAVAVAVQLAWAGVSQLFILNRTPARALALAERVQALVPSCQVVGSGWDLAYYKETWAWLQTADLVVNASRLGMGAQEDADLKQSLPFSPEVFRAGQVVYDLVYHPLYTPLVRAARAQGAVVVTGDRMLLYQGALAFRLWTGLEPPVPVMEEALRQALAQEEFSSPVSKETPARPSAELGKRGEG